MMMIYISSISFSYTLLASFHFVLYVFIKHLFTRPYMWLGNTRARGHGANKIVAYFFIIFKEIIILMYYLIIKIIILSKH